MIVRVSFQVTVRRCRVARLSGSSGAATKREFARFLDSAVKSVNETKCRLLSARDRNTVLPDLRQSVRPRPSRSASDSRLQQAPRRERNHVKVKFLYSGRGGDVEIPTRWRVAYFATSIPPHGMWCDGCRCAPASVHRIDFETCDRPDSFFKSPCPSRIVVS
jgi:hypothetical protein